MTPISSMILGFAVTAAPLTDAKYSLQHARPIVTLLVRDLVGINPPIRSVAKAQAIRILDRAGIDLRWIDAGASDDPNLTSTSYLTVVIAAKPPIRWTKPDAMGFAPARTGPYPRAYVFSTMIASFIDKFTLPSETNYGIVLGHAIAHELGHLLISGDAHGQGIMRPNWAYQEWQQALKGTLLFVPNHASAMREGLQSK